MKGKEEPDVAQNCSQKKKKKEFPTDLAQGGVGQKKPRELWGKSRVPAGTKTLGGGQGMLRETALQGG